MDHTNYFTSPSQVKRAWFVCWLLQIPHRAAALPSPPVPAAINTVQASPLFRARCSPQASARRQRRGQPFPPQPQPAAPALGAQIRLSVSLQPSRDTSSAAHEVSHVPGLFTDAVSALPKSPRQKSQRKQHSRTAAQGLELATALPDWRDRPSGVHPPGYTRVTGPTLSSVAV